MSRLAVGSDDHPEAALKNLGDAQALGLASRFDGAAYLSGYAVECSLKSVILFQQVVDSTTGTVDGAKLNAWHKKLRSKDYGHDIMKLASEVTTPAGAKYAPSLPFAASIFAWSETLRYRAAGHVGETEARGFLAWAESLVQVVRVMQLDGVI